MTLNYRHQGRYIEQDWNTNERYVHITYTECFIAPKGRAREPFQSTLEFYMDSFSTSLIFYFVEIMFD